MSTRGTAHLTAPEDRVSIPARLAYGMGGFVNNILAGAMGSMMIVLNLGLGLPPSWVGYLGALPRLTDAITDPLMGYISDKSSTRWGRRRPFIFAGAILAALSFVLLWQLPTGKSDTFYFIWFLVGSFIFYLAYTCFATPWVALGYELTPDYHERTRLMGTQNFISQLAYLVTPWFLWVVQHEIWGEGGMVTGARGLAVVIGMFTVAFGILPAVFLRERFGAKALVLEPDAQPKAAKSLGESMADFVKGFGVTLMCRPFLLLCLATFLVFNGFILISSFQSYVIIYYVFGGDQLAGGAYVGYSGTLQGVATFVVIAIATTLSSRIGKRKAFFTVIGVSVVGYLAKWFCYDPGNPLLVLLPAPLMAFGLGGLFTLLPAMVADVVDMDELQTHERREGMFGSIFWWVVKLGMAAALAGGGELLELTGFDEALGGNQSEATLIGLRALDAGVPALASLLAIAIVAAYPLTESRAQAIRSQLEERRGRIGVAH